MKVIDTRTDKTGPFAFDEGQEVRVEFEGGADTAVYRYDGRTAELFVGLDGMQGADSAAQAAYFTATELGELIVFLQAVQRALVPGNTVLELPTR